LHGFASMVGYHLKFEETCLHLSLTYILVVAGSISKAPSIIIPSF
jgi:hypothetical protein